MFFDFCNRLIGPKRPKRGVLGGSGWNMDFSYVFIHKVVPPSRKLYSPVHHLKKFFDPFGRVAGPPLVGSAQCCAGPPAEDFSHNLFAPLLQRLGGTRARRKPPSENLEIFLTPQIFFRSQLATEPQGYPNTRHSLSSPFSV